MKFFLLVIFVLLTSCATPYQSSSFMGGFDEIKLSDDSYQVNFRGNKYSSTQRAIDFTLLRSAELTLENGYSYFIVVDSEVRSSHKRL
jgi:hypothetical protein